MYPKSDASLMYKIISIHHNYAAASRELFYAEEAFGSNGKKLFFDTGKKWQQKGDLPKKKVSFFMLRGTACLLPFQSSRKWVAKRIIGGAGAAIHYAVNTQNHSIQHTHTHTYSRTQSTYLERFFVGFVSFVRSSSSSS